MADSREYAKFTGFTENEINELCRGYNMPSDETKRWYDGYHVYDYVPAKRTKRTTLLSSVRLDGTLAYTFFSGCTDRKNIS